MPASSRGMVCRQAAVVWTQALSFVLPASQRAAGAWCTPAACLCSKPACRRLAAAVSTPKKATPVRAPGAQRPMTMHWTTEHARGPSTRAVLRTAASELPCGPVQECKALNGRLLDFLKQASVVQQLVTYLVIPAQPGELWPLGPFH